MLAIHLGGAEAPPRDNCDKVGDFPQKFSYAGPHYHEGELSLR